MSTDDQPGPSKRQTLRNLAQDVMRHTERGKGVTYAGDISSIVQSARQLAEMVLELTAKPQPAPPAVEAQPAVEAPPPQRSFREIEKYGLELRARAHAKYPHPTPEQRQKIEAKIERLVKAFSGQKVAEPGQPHAEESGTAFESLPKQTPAAAPQRPRHPPPPSLPAKDRDELL